MLKFDCNSIELQDAERLHELLGNTYIQSLKPDWRMCLLSHVISQHPVTQ